MSEDEAAAAEPKKSTRFKKGQGYPRGQPRRRVTCPKCGASVADNRLTAHVDSKGCIKRQAELASPPIKPATPQEDVAWGEDEIPSLEELEQEAMRDQVGQPGAAAAAAGVPPGQPVLVAGAGAAGAMAPAQISGEDLAVLLDPDLFWGGSAEFVNGSIKHERYKIRMTHDKAMRLHNALARVIPVVLTSPYGALAITVFMVFGMPWLADRWASSREKREAEEAAKKAAAGVKPTPPAPAAAPAEG